MSREASRSASADDLANRRRTKPEAIMGCLGRSGLWRAFSSRLMGRRCGIARARFVCVPVLCWLLPGCEWSISRFWFFGTSWRLPGNAPSRFAGLTALAVRSNCDPARILSLASTRHRVWTRLCEWKGRSLCGLYDVFYSGLLDCNWPIGWRLMIDSQSPR